MNINNMINEKIFTINCESSSKKEVLNAMAKGLYEDQRISNLEVFFKDVIARETIESTNMEVGVAIPHSKSSTILKSSISFCRLTHPIDWEDNGPPVKIIFLLAVSPYDEGITHLEVIAKLAELLIEDDFINLLITAKSNKIIINYMKQQLA